MRSPPRIGTAHHRAAGVGAGHHADAVGLRVRQRAQHERVPAFAQDAPRAHRIGDHGRQRQPHAVLVLVEIVDEVGLVVVPADADLLGAEHFAQLVADEVDDGLEVELRRHAFLDAVDHRQLGGATLGLLEQALRLVEQARVFQRHAHRVGERGQQVDVLVRERVLAVGVDGDHAERLVALENRHAEVAGGDDRRLDVADHQGAKLGRACGRDRG